MMRYKIISLFLIIVTNISAANIKFSNKSITNDYSVVIDENKFLTTVAKNSESSFFKFRSKTLIKIQDRDQVVHKQTLFLEPTKTYVGIFGGARNGLIIEEVRSSGGFIQGAPSTSLNTENEIISRDSRNTASVQIIHNSPTPTVDIYVDGVEALGDVPYRATTALIDLPTSTTVGIAPADGDVIAEFPFTLEADAHYVVTASGIVGDTDRPFDLVASTLETAATDNDHFALKVYHGVTDAPAVDIYADGSLLVENLSFGEYAGYVQVPVGDYTIDVTASGSTVPVASFSAPLSGQGGGAGIVFASGFLAPVAATDPAFTLILTTPSGYSVELPAAATALSTIVDNNVNPGVFNLKQNYPNPFNPTTSINFEIFESSRVSLSIYDLSGRLVKNLLSGTLNSGAYSIDWSGKNNNGISVAAGVYFYSLSSDKNTIIKKMSLIN